VEDLDEQELLNLFGKIWISNVGDIDSKKIPKNQVLEGKIN
jgi:hypothetical protein